jgi:hypothetical protein
MNNKRKAGIIVLSAFLIFGALSILYSEKIGFRGSRYYEYLHSSMNFTASDNPYKNITLLVSADDAKNKANEYLKDFQKRVPDIINYTITSSGALKPYWSNALCKNYFKVGFDFYYIPSVAGSVDNQEPKKASEELTLCDDGQIAYVFIPV